MYENTNKNKPKSDNKYEEERIKIIYEISKKINKSFKNK